MTEKKKVAAPEFKAMKIDTKAVSAEPDADGFVYIKAYGSVFDVLDSHNDMTVKGTFAETLKEWEEKDAPIPSYYNHSMFSGDPMDNVGFVKNAEEDDHGLAVEIALDVEHNEKAAYVHRLIKQGRLRELSIGYIPQSWEHVKRDGARHDWDTYRKLTAVELLEISIVALASNRQSTVTEKAAAVDGEPELASAISALVAATVALTAVAGKVTATETSDEDEAEEPAAKSDDPDQPVGTKSLSARARAALAMIAVSAAETE